MKVPSRRQVGFTNDPEACTTRFLVGYICFSAFEYAFDGKGGRLWTSDVVFIVSP